MNKELKFDRRDVEAVLKEYLADWLAERIIDHLTEKAQMNELKDQLEEDER